MNLIHWFCHPILQIFIAQWQTEMDSFGFSRQEVIELEDSHLAGQGAVLHSDTDK